GCFLPADRKIMLRLLSVIALAAVALADEPDFSLQMEGEFASLDPVFGQKLEKISGDMDISLNQKVAAVHEAINALPADQQEKANKFIKFGLDKEQQMINLAKSLIPEFSAEAQTVLNNVVNTYANGNDVPTKQLNENIKKIIDESSGAVKNELNAAKSEHVAKMQEFVKSMILEARA
ncbi:hypothetical protein PFISCL1PPCAC_7587, partial [Pristionchus fissidentatus]